MAVAILSVGEAITDVVHRAGGTEEFSGGSPLNVAVGLARLGREVSLLTAIGDDERGRAITTHLDTAGVELAPGSLSGYPTSTSQATIGADGAASYRFDIHWSFPEDREPAFGMVHVGSVGAFVEPGGSGVERFVEASAAVGAVVSFDPNVRPAIFGSQPAAVARFERIAGNATVVKLSDEDAAWLYPHDAPEAVLDSLVSRGVSLAVLTRGSHGAVLRTSEHSIVVPAAATSVVDTIGAGDSFMAALLYQLARQLDAGSGEPLDLSYERVLELGRFSVQCASICVARPGADPPFLGDLSH